MKDKDVFIFGDSIVYGVGDNEKCGWVNRFRLDLENSNIGDYNVFNLGIFGDVTQGVINEEFSYDYKLGLNLKLIREKMKRMRRLLFLP